MFSKDLYSLQNLPGPLSCAGPAAQLPNISTSSTLVPRYVPRSPAPEKWPISRTRSVPDGAGLSCAVLESPTSDSEGGNGSPGLALGSALGNVPKEQVKKSWGWWVGVLVCYLSAESSLTPAAAAGKGHHHQEKSEQAGSRGAGSLQAGPFRRRSPWGHGAGGAQQSPGEGSGSAGDSTAEELGRCFVGKKECCPHCSPWVAPWAAAFVAAATVNTAWAEEAVQAAGRVACRLFSVICDEKTA